MGKILNRRTVKTAHCDAHWTGGIAKQEYHVRRAGEGDMGIATRGAVHASVHNHFNQERPFYSRKNFKLNRSAALAEWRELSAA